MSDAVLYEVKGNIGLITLNRPERLNAWNGDMSAGYFGSLDKAIADPEVRVIVVTGAGRGFCAGADMDVLQGIQGAGGSAPAENRDARFAMTVPKPIIAAINGACAGMGLSHALACDIRFAAAGAKFTVAFSRRGLIAEHGISWTLPRLVGQAAALDLILSGRVFLAEEAAELGAVNKVLPADELMDYTMAYAEDLATNVSPTSMAVMKHQIYSQMTMPIDEAMSQTIKVMKESLKRSDFKEGVSSFLEKRPPNFPPYQP